MYNMEVTVTFLIIKWEEQFPILIYNLKLLIIDFRISGNSQPYYQHLDIYTYMDNIFCNCGMCWKEYETTQSTFE